MSKKSLPKRAELISDPGLEAPTSAWPDGEGSSIKHRWGRGEATRAETDLSADARPSQSRAGGPVANDLTDEVFGRLKVLRRDGSSPYGAAVWLCRCECQNLRRVVGSSLRSGSARSCGCLRRETTKTRRRTHGATAGGRGTRTYRIWADIRARCENPLNPSYPTHGGRGVTVDPRWNDYAEFLKDMGEAPPGQTLGRFDVKGPYDKTNCRWGERARARPRVPEETLTKVRSDYAAGGVTQKEIARRYGLSPSKVCVIVSDLKPASAALQVHEGGPGWPQAGAIVGPEAG